MNAKKSDFIKIYGRRKNFSGKTLVEEDSELPLKKKTVQQNSSSKYLVRLRFWIFPPSAQYLALVEKSEITISQDHLGLNYVEL